MTHPTAVRFAPDGRVFVAEKGGRILVYDDVDDPTPTVFADLSTNVYNAWDRGLLGLAIDPQFPARPFVYVLYSFDAPIGGTAPVWNDGCPDPPGFTGDGCVVSGRLSRLTAGGDVMVGPEVVLIEDWCQQFPSHSIGDLHFGLDGALYASAGEGASFNFVDHGQNGNPCDDPPHEGGALRSQDIRTAGDPVTLDGTLIRVDPKTGLALPDNPLFGGVELGDDRIIAHGLRNPYRFAIHPLTNEVWIGDVGWDAWEELNHVPDPLDLVVENFGWPCYEGAVPQEAFDGSDLPICEDLYSEGTATPPYHAFVHSGTSALSGLAFYLGGDYPAEYEGALFFADYGARRIKLMFPDADGNPDPGNILNFRNRRAVDLQIGPDGDVYYVHILAGEVHRFDYFPANAPPTAVIYADATSGLTPLAITLDGTASFDPDGGAELAYAWDLDGDGQFDDSTDGTALATFLLSGNYRIGLEVTDSGGATGVATLQVTAGNEAPVVSILTPGPSFTWRVGQRIDYSGQAIDPGNGLLPPTSYEWAIRLQHCSHDDPDDCHEHLVQDLSGFHKGSFIAIDHEYPSFLEIRLTATDPGFSDWWNAAWSRRQHLTFQNGAQGELTDFPVLVRLDPTRIDYGRTKADGMDLRFVASDASTVLPHEIESWDPTGVSEVWVRVPTIAAASSSDFVWMYYDNPLATPGQVLGGVWDQTYAGVWHMDASLEDSTPESNHGTNAGSIATPGQVGEARFFDGIDASISMGSAIDVGPAGELTLEAWVQVADPEQPGTPCILSKKSQWNGPTGYDLEYRPADDNLACVGSGADFARAHGVDLDTGWHHVGVALFGHSPLAGRSAGTGDEPDPLPGAALYVDGVERTTDPTIGPIVAGLEPLVLGRRSGGGDPFFGSLDEVRVSKVARSADWMAAQYLSMSDTFVSYGPVSDAGRLTDEAQITLEPETSQLTLNSRPSGFQLVLFSASATAPSEHEVIVNSVTTVSAITPQIKGGNKYEFVSWSDGGGRTHDIVVSENDQELTAFFRLANYEPTDEPSPSEQDPVPGPR